MWWNHLKYGYWKRLLIIFCKEEEGIAQYHTSKFISVPIWSWVPAGMKPHSGLAHGFTQKHRLQHWQGYCKDWLHPLVLQWECRGGNQYGLHFSTERTHMHTSKPQKKVIGVQPPTLGYSFILEKGDLHQQQQNNSRGAVYIKESKTMNLWVLGSKQVTVTLHCKFLRKSNQLTSEM